MKTITKIFGIALLAFAAAALSSCNEEEYTPADPVDGPQVFFSPDSPSTVELSSKESSFDVTLLRATKDEAVSFTLEVSDTSGLFTVPTSVSFAAGQTTVTLTIGYSYNEDDFPFDFYYGLTLNIPDGYNTPYGLNEYDFEAGVPGPWTSLGMCEFNDYFFFEDTYEVEIFQNDLNPNQFRLEYPYAEGLVAEDYVDDGDQWGGDQYLVLTVLQPGDVVANGETITESDLVNYGTYNTGWYYDSYESYVVLYYPYYFSGYETEDMWEHNRVLSYQEPDEEGNVLPAQIQLAPFFYLPDYGGGWNYSQYDEVVIITFPGVVIADYSVDVSYVGKLTDAAGYNYIVGDFTLGEDVEYAEVALVATDDADEAVEAVLDGTADTQKITGSCSVNFPVSEDGTYYIVAVTYDADDEAQEHDTAKVKYSSGGTSDPLADLIGTYEVQLNSYWYGEEDAYYWVFDYSDDSTQGNFMLTYFDGWPCDWPIYGDYDSNEGTFVIYSSQPFYYYYGYYLYFMVSGGNYVTFSLDKPGVFSGPNDYMFGEYMLNASDSSDQGWNDAFDEILYCQRVSTDTELSSVATASTSSVKDGTGRTLSLKARSIEGTSVNVKSTPEGVIGPQTAPEHFFKK